MAATATIRVFPETRELIQQMSEATNKSTAEIVDVLVNDARERAMIGQFNAYFDDPANRAEFDANETRPWEATLADGLAGNIEAGAVTFELVRDHVGAVASVTEHEIEEAVRFLARAHGIVAEGAGAVAVAGVMAGRVRPVDGPLVVLVTGRNIALPRFAEVLGGA